LDTEVEAWLRSPTVDNLQELDFCYVRDYGLITTWRSWTWGPPFLRLPPASTFRFAATLSVASIGACHLPDNTIDGLHFPQLKHLGLQWVLISEGSIHRLIAGCPALECLLIYYITGFYSLRINAPRLRSIGVRTYFHHNQTGGARLENLIIENAPCLERLFRMHLFDDIQLSIISAPKLVETIGSIDNYHPSFSKITEVLLLISCIAIRA
jgi:hypothetical protein